MDKTNSKIPVESLTDQVADRLSVIIREGAENGLNTIPSERLLAEQLGVSRQIVREAIKRLEIQGLLEVRHGKSIKIVDQLHRPVSGSLELLIPEIGDRLVQLQEARIVIEPEAARLAALRGSEESIGNLRTIHNSLVDSESIEETVEIDLRFHRAITEASGNLVFRLLLDSLTDISRESRRRTIGRVGKQVAVEHHELILLAIESRCPQAAANAMRLHVEVAFQDLGLQVLATHTL